MDYDDDGVLDFISGSYDPGDLYLFRGLGGGEYAKVENILDKSGQPVVHHPKEFAKYLQLKDDPKADEDDRIMARVASFGSWVAPVDWENDGDLDLLIGSFGGELFRRVNEGTRGKPEYGTESIPVLVDGEPFKIHSHANPVVADWDGDGTWDLIVSSGDGSVGWYRNTGSKSEPQFGPRRLLVAAAAPHIFLEQNLEPGEVPVPGVRAQICVADYNRDGRLDLILGDYSDINRTRDLGPSERKKLQALNARIKEISDEIQNIRASLQQLAEAKQGDPDAAETRESGDDRKSGLMEKIRVLADEYQKASDTRKSYFSESRNAGFVWLFLRKVPDESTVGFRVGSKGPTLDLSTTTNQNDSRDGVAGDSPVSVSAWLASAESDSAATHKLTVEIRIKAGWHIYASAPEGSPWQVTDIKVVRPKGLRAVGAWQRPQGLPNAEDPTTKVFEGTVKFARNFRVADDDDIESLEIEVDYQVCNDQLCLRPSTIRKSVALESAK